MSNLPALLLASLSPDTRKQAEQHLDSLSSQPGFLSALLRLVLDSAQDRSVRLAGSVYLKNVAKTRWDEETPSVQEQDKALLRSELLPAMLSLSNPTDKNIRAQVVETVSLIAQADFPPRWPNLIDQLVMSLSPTEYIINVGVLETAHSIFRRWRSGVRSDELFTEINLVLETFMKPFLQLFKQTATILLENSAAPPPSYPSVAQAQDLLVEIYYDFSCQDLPPDLEDTHEEFFKAQTGWFSQLIDWDPPSVRNQEDDTTPSFPVQIKTGILAIAELYIKLYPEQLLKSAAVEGYVQQVWALVGSGKLPGVSSDPLVSQCLRFLSTAIRSGYYEPLFSSKETISSLVQGVIVPNITVRDHDLEQFEDDPLEFIRLDLSLPSIGAGSSEAATRRQAAADVLQAFVGSGLEAETTEIVGQWIAQLLQDYTANPVEKWKSKDTAIYLLTAVATKGSTAQHGVTSTNALIDVVKFFSDNVFQDLQAGAGAVNPLLQVDAIRFLHTFRNQLTKEQLMSVLPLLVHHINSDNYVTYTYAAITIERILFIKQGGRLVFTQTDIHEIAINLLGTILSKIESAGTPEKVAENDHLIKCGMRVIVTARQSLTPGYQQILQRLVLILGVISKNPSNPHFDQYIFESISGLMRFVVGSTPSTLPTFEQALFGPFTIILQQDIDQYIPYTFQILAQMLELHTGDVPPEYRSLLPFLLTPAIWQQKGSIPGLVKLLKAFLAKDGQQILATGQFASILAVVQQRLIPSKLNDAWGFELLNSVVQHIPPAQLKQYFKVILMTLLTRMQTSKTDKFVYLFSLFCMFTMAIRVDGLSPDYLISTVEEIQPQLWSQIMTNFIIPQIPKMPIKDRKITAVGLTNMLTKSEFMLRDPSIRAWPTSFTSLVRLFREPQYLKGSQKDDDPDLGLTEIDFEEQTAGYQAAYSRLAASETAPVDPVAYVQDPREYLGQNLVALSKSSPQIKTLLTQADAGVVGPLVQELSAAGLAL